MKKARVYTEQSEPGALPVAAGEALQGRIPFARLWHKRGPPPSSVRGHRSRWVEAGESITLVNGEGDACSSLRLSSASSPPGPVPGSAAAVCHRRDLVNVHANDENPGVESR